MTEPGAEFAGRIVADATRLIASSLGDFIPAEAQGHLLAAQRELLLALAVILEHNQARFRGSDITDDDAGGETGTDASPRRRRTARRRSGPRRPQRVELE